MARSLRSLGSAGLEGAVRLAARRVPAAAVDPRAEPRSILVLRNNDLGDLLVITPLFEALRRRFPGTELVAGVGSWATDVLVGNPHLSGVATVDAPWFNRGVGRQGALARWRYLARSPQVRELARRRFEVGIDVLGSAWGSLLLMRAAIPCRLGVHGYAGGHGGASACIEYFPQERVGRMALRFAELLGATELPEARPQLFLTAEEIEEAEARWRELGTGEARATRRLVLAPGAGLPEKRWPLPSFVELTKALVTAPGVRIAVVGGPHDREAGAELARLSPRVRSFCGDGPLRGTFALLATGQGAITNSSMALHAGAAFSRPTLVLLGPAFDSVREHDAQWGHPGSVTLGPERGERRGIASVEKALDRARRLFPAHGG